MPPASTSEITVQGKAYFPRGRLQLGVNRSSAPGSRIQSERGPLATRQKRMRSLPWAFGLKDSFARSSWLSEKPWKAPGHSLVCRQGQCTSSRVGQ